MLGFFSFILNRPLYKLQFFPPRCENTKYYIVIYIYKICSTYTILPKVLGRPLLMNRFDYFSNFYEYKS